MTALYETRLVIASLKNVPSLGYSVAHFNGEQAKKQHGDLIIVTESWDAAVKRGFKAGIDGSYDWLDPHRQSVMLGTDLREWDIEDEGVIKGGAGPYLEHVNDRRDLLWRRQTRRDTGRKLVALALHTSPIPWLKAPHMVPAARRSQQHAARQVEAIAGNTGYPVVMGGDINRKRRLTDSDRIAGQKVGNGIVHAEMWHGRNARFGVALAHGYKQRSDHPGVTIDLRLVAA